MNGPRFQFEGYTVRLTEERDRAFLEQLIEGDPYHRGKMTADFFIQKEPGVDCWALEDEHGEVVFYFKTRTAVRMYIQFRPIQNLTDRLRNHVAMLKGLRWVESRLAATGFRELICDTEAPELAGFLERRLGFKEAATLCRWLSSMPDAPKMPSRSCASLTNEGVGREVTTNVRS